MSRLGKFIMGSSVRTETRVTLVDANTADLDGVNQTFSITDNASLRPTDFTIAAWVKTTTSTAFAGLIDRMLGGTGGYAIHIPDGVTHLPRCQVRDGASSYTATGSSSVGDGNWHLVVGTFNSGTSDLKVYTDAVLEDTTASASLGYGTEDLYIGGDGSSTNELDGSLGFCGLWSEDIGQTSITTLYQSGVALSYDKLVTLGLDTDLVSYWELANWNGSTGTEIEDKHGSNDLTNNNSTPFDGTGLQVRTV